MIDFDFTKEPGKSLLRRNLNDTGDPLLSVITPYYNAGKYFEQTFYCVMNQTFPWFEWIIVDDGSDDQNSIELLEQYEVRDRRIRVLHQENKGQSAARNAAARNSRSSFLVPLDADDLIAPTFLEELYWAMLYHRDAGWAYTDSVGFSGQEYLWIKPFSVGQMKNENLLTCTAIIRKSCFWEVGGYDESAKHYDEDWHLWLRLLAQGEYPVHIRGCLFWYRRSTEGMQRRVQKDQILQKISQQKIAQAAEGITQDIQPIEYPQRNCRRNFPKPSLSDWDRKIFQRHDKTCIMMLLPWLEMGGADLFNLDICRMIDREKFEISILTTEPSENSWRQRFEEYVTDIFTLPDFLSSEHFPEFISYFIKSREIDILFLSNSYYGYYLVPWLRMEFPELAIIDYVHMEEWYWRNGGYARTSGAMGGILEKTYVCNERTRQVMIRDFGRSPECVETLYIGVDQERYAANTVESGLVRATLGIAPDRPAVLFPCRIHPQKRPFLMVEIAKAVRKEIADIAFIVVGDGPQLEELRSIVLQEDLQQTIYLAGRQSDMRPYYKDSDLTLICSLKEGLALTAYESLSMGKPVVSADTGGQAELIDSSVGRILPLLQSEAEDLDKREFPAQEIQQYAAAVIEILTDQDAYAMMSAACRRKIEERFSSQRMIKTLEGVFEDLQSPKAREARKMLAAGLARFPAMVKDYFTMYCMWESKEQESEEIWISREWFRGLYERELVKKDGPVNCLIPDNESAAQRQLEEIYQMRSWKLLQKYRHFMDDTVFGRLLSKIRNILLGKRLDANEKSA